MIARIAPLLILLILLPDIYIYRFQLRRRPTLMRRLRWLCWLPCVVMIAYTLLLALTKNFLPADIIWVEIYLFMLGLIVVPKAVYTFCSFAGHYWRVLTKSPHNYGNLIGFPVAFLFILLWAYSMTIGPTKLCVKHVDLYFTDLPRAFDGYRIAHISDLHVGSFTGSKLKLLQRDIDSVNILKPDLICFTGDLENMQPTELPRVMPVISKLQAKDGLASVLGNHDYSQYVKADSAVKQQNERRLIHLQRTMGWTLLLNENIKLRRGVDSLVIAGMENDGKPPYPSKADIHKTLATVDSAAFCIMLEHDPASWRRTILPNSRAQLTLSGHTHGGQVSFFGLSLIRLMGHEDRGLYTEGSRQLYVNPGLGGAVMFRLGVTPEITLITLHRKP